MRNYPEWVIAFSAALAAGAIAVPLNAWWTTQELEYGLSRLRGQGADRRRRARRADCAACGVR